MLRSIFIFIAMSVGIVAALFNRFAALLMYIWFALFRPQEWLWVDIAGLHLSLVLGVLLVLPSLATGILPNLTHPISIGMIVFLLSALVAQTQAVNAAVGWEWMDYLSRLILVSLLATTLISSKRRFLWTVTIVAVSIGFHSAKAGLASFIGGGVQFDAGQAGSFIDNNGYALAIAMTVPLQWFAGQMWSREAPEYKWVARGFFVSVPLSAFALICTFSRAGFLALIAVVLTYVMLQKRRLRTLAVLVVVLGVTLPFVPFPKGYFNRVETIRTYDEVQDDSALSRLHFWQVAMQMASANPLGVGLRNFELAYDRYDFSHGRYGNKRAVHSSHFEVLAENGFAGAAVWLGLFGYSIVVLLRLRRHERREGVAEKDAYFIVNASNALLMSIVAFLVGGAFIALSLNDLTWYTFSFVAALDRLSRRNVEIADPSAYVATSPDLMNTTYISDPRSSVARSIHSCPSLA